MDIIDCPSGSSQSDHSLVANEDGCLSTLPAFQNDVSDGDIPDSSTELIVLDESGCDDDEEGEVKSLTNSYASVGHAIIDDKQTIVTKPTGELTDSDIEIVSDKETSESFDSRDSLTNCRDKEMRCHDVDCPFMKESNAFKKKYRLVKRALKRLKKKTRLSSRLIESKVEIKFLDQSLIKKYGTVVENFIENLLKSEVVGSCSNENSLSSSSATSANYSIPMLHETFYIDKRRQNEESLQSLEMEMKLPFYEARHFDRLGVKDAQSDKEKKNNARPAVSCFNCEGDHAIADCTQPRNSQRILRNRNEFMSKRQNLSSPRYHVDHGRNDKFQPGKLSNALRRALGLNNDELPIHIYKMRLIGYPPGWLKEAEIHSSGITVYDSEGKAQDDFNSGNGFSNRRDNRVLHDPAKLVDFPGFNVIPSQGTVDKWQILGFPPMRDFQMRKVVEQFINSTAPNKRKRSPDVDIIDDNKKRLKISETVIDDSMDIEECQYEVQFVDPVHSTPISASDDISIVDDCVTVGVNNVTESTSVIESPESDGCSMSLEDLENEKKKLISELCVENTSNDDTFSGKSKAVVLGSPAIYQASCFSKLPGADKFAVGITEHMNFENLPDSAGSFEKVRHTLKGVRQYLSQLKK